MGGHGTVGACSSSAMTVQVPGANHDFAALARDLHKFMREVEFEAGDVVIEVIRSTIFCRPKRARPVSLVTHEHFCPRAFLWLSDLVMLDSVCWWQMPC
jgi:hypothetical protein